MPKQLNFRLSGAICALVLLFSSALFGQSIKAYFPYYRSVAQANAVQYNKLTDVIYAFASLNSDGSLAIMSPNIFDAVQAKCAANGVKLHIAIGGWGLSGNFSGVAANATYRNNLANACLSLCQSKGLAGIDIDWEFPASYDKYNYTAMLQAIKSKLGTTYTLSAALGGEAGHSVGIESAAFGYLDYFNIMSYDAPGSYGNHTSVQFMKDAMEIYKNLGCPYSKMVPGTAFYGRCGGEETYAGISAGDPAGFYNDADGNYGNWCYDSRPTLEAKIDWVMGQKGGSGIMIWEISQDRNDQYSLLNAMRTKMNNYTGTPCTLGDPDLGPSFSICGSGSVALKAYSGTAPNANYVWKNGSSTVGSTNSYTATAAGTYTVTVSTSPTCSKSKSTTITSTMPAVNLGSAKDICSTPTVTLDAGVSGNGFTYQWSLNSNTISNATSQTYAASQAGSYSVTVSANGCGSQSGTVAVTSSLVSIDGVSRCGTGTVTMNVNSPVSGATYDWYTAQTNGTKVNSGTSYTPTISNTTIYYVEKVSAGSGCAGVTSYDASQNYPGGSVVSYNGTKYTSAYWANPNEYPGKIAGQWNDGGACGGASSCTRTPVTATVTSGCSISPTITLANASKTYGDATFTMAATSNSTGAFTYSITSGTAATITSDGVVTIKGAGSVTVTVSQAAANNYNAGSTTAMISIAKKALAVKANDVSRTYNTANPVFTASYTGFAGNDNASSLTTQPNLSTTASKTSSVGNYGITVSGAASGNYTFTYTNGTLTVVGMTPAITFTNSNVGAAGNVITLAATSNSNGVMSFSVANGTGSATLANGNKLTLKTAGTVIVTVNIVASGNYAAGSNTQTISISENTVGVNDFTFDASVHVYPNPVAEKLHASFTLQTHSNVIIELIDIDGGHVVATAHNTFDAGTHEMHLALPHLANKIYICRISHEGKITLSKIAVKQ